MPDCQELHTFRGGYWRGQVRGQVSQVNDDVIIYTSSCATVHRSDSERFQCQFPCWLFLCWQKDRFRSGFRKAAREQKNFHFCKSVNNILHAVCRHLHNTNTKCMLFPLCHDGLHSVVKGELDCDDLQCRRKGDVFILKLEKYLHLQQRTIS